MKHCICCGELKPLSDYYVHKQMGDGHLNKCKECIKDYAHKKWRINIEDPEFVEKQRKRGRDKYYRLGYNNPREIKGALACARDYKKRYPEKKFCVIRSQRVPVEKRGNHRHHWSYNPQHAKDIIELSKRDHLMLHKHIIYDQNFFMYRRSDTLELLDTKEKHLAYFWHVKANEERIGIAS